MWSLATVLIVAAAASASVVQQRPEKRVADAAFLTQQKQVLELFVGFMYNQNWDETESFQFNEATFDLFTDPKYPKEFLRIYKRGMLPKTAVFNVYCHFTRHDAIKLFDVFYFAKDFDTFIKVAKWAKTHVNPGIFAFTYILALTHRSDTQSFVYPTAYEVAPNFFTPADTLQRVFVTKMVGIKEGRFTYNNSGYEYNYHGAMFGGLLTPDNRGYGDFRVSYFREDIGLNDYLLQFEVRNPTWMSSKKYKSPWLQRSAENRYYTLQQLFARYTQERFSHGLPNVEPLDWTKPIKVGYNPRLAYLNGQSMYNRPDNLIPEHYNPTAVSRTRAMEKRVWDAIDAGAVWETSNKTLLPLNNEDGIHLLGNIFFGEQNRPSRGYFQPAFWIALETLAYLTTTASDRSYIGNAISTPLTYARDPAYYNYLASIIKVFQHFKGKLGPYSHDEVAFEGVKVQNVEMEKLLTYFDMCDYDVTNAVPMQKRTDYKDHKYYARQYRLNHKPYNYNVTVNSNQAGDAIVRVFLGQKYDPDETLLNLEQARLTFFEIDRFTAKLTPGINVFKRSSKESPIFAPDRDGLRALFANLDNAMNNMKTPFYVPEYEHCGVPERLQLPKGWRGGRPAQLAVVVNSYDDNKAQEGNDRLDIACGGAALYDGRPMGFPFDRPIRHDELHVPNILFKGVHVYHRDE